MQSLQCPITLWFLLIPFSAEQLDTGLKTSWESRKHACGQFSICFCDFSRSYNSRQSGRRRKSLSVSIFEDEASGILNFTNKCAQFRQSYEGLMGLNELKLNIIVCLNKCADLSRKWKKQQSLHKRKAAQAAHQQRGCVASSVSFFVYWNNRHWFICLNSGAPLHI